MNRAIGVFRAIQQRLERELGAETAKRLVEQGRREAHQPGAPIGEDGRSLAPPGDVAKQIREMLSKKGSGK